MIGTLRENSVAGGLLEDIVGGTIKRLASGGKPQGTGGGGGAPGGGGGGAPGGPPATTALEVIPAPLPKAIALPRTLWEKIRVEAVEPIVKPFRFFLDLYRSAHALKNSKRPPPSEE